MIVDTSAVLAVLFLEPDAERYERAIVDAARCRCQPPTSLRQPWLWGAVRELPVGKTLTT